MIISKSNSLIKEIRSLKDKKFRDELNEFVAEGIKTVNEAIKSGLNIKCIVTTEKAYKNIYKTNFRIEIVDEDIFNSISGEVTPQGVLAVVEKPQFCQEKPNGNCLLLDGIQDPSNMGAIIRTAVASGYKDIYLIDTVDPFNPKSVRASMSGIFKANFHTTTRKTAKNDISLPLVVADMDGENIFSFKAPQKFCLVIGNEGNGVSEEILKEKDYTVSIPMENEMESLNAGVSAGILMYILKTKPNLF